MRGWKKLPQGLKKSFLDQGWKVFLTNSRGWRNDKENRSLAGFITNKSEEILIKASLDDLDMILYHEFGHYLYIISNSIHAGSIHNAYIKEKNQYFSIYNDDYGISNAEEYFAQIFAHYIRHPEQIKNRLPESYNFIDSITQKYK